MTTKYGEHFSTLATPQSESIPGERQVLNSAGGYVYALDPWQRLDRFLIMGSEGGTYYVGERKLTIDNARSILELIHQDGIRVCTRTVEISHSGRAPSNDPALFVLAMAAGQGDKDTRRYALRHLHKVARTGTHLFTFLDYVKAFRGRGRLLHEALQFWYRRLPIRDLSHQLVKYQSRGGWSHRKVLRLCRPQPQDEAQSRAFGWAVDRTKIPNTADLEYIEGYMRALEATTEREWVRLIKQYRLTHEMLPKDALTHASVWGALLPHMPLRATIWNLGRMTALGLLKPLSVITDDVCRRITDAEYIARSRLHPIVYAIALRTYAKGVGMRSEWSPVATITDALDAGFYASFGTIEPMGGNTLLALDVSGSMGAQSGVQSLTCAEVAAVMAMATARTEKSYQIMGFSHELKDLGITSSQRLDDVLATTSDMTFGRTDCGLPARYARVYELHADQILIYTDNETWSGPIHPKQELAEYRKRVPQAKQVVVGITSTGFTIADPADPLSLDVVGFDASAPAVISDFCRGQEDRGGDPRP